MPNPYPAEFTDAAGIERLAGALEFTDPANQPTGTVPAGWSAAGSPAYVNSNGGNLDLGGTGHLYNTGGVEAAPAAGTAAFHAGAGNGATIALDATGGTMTLGSGIAVVSLAVAPPVAYATPLVFDSTLVTGGLYAWDGAAYQQVGGPL